MASGRQYNCRLDECFILTAIIPQTLGAWSGARCCVRSVAHCRKLEATHMSEKSPYMANLCPFYLGVADVICDRTGAFCTNAGGPCKRFLKQSGYRVAPPSRLASKGDRSKEDSNEKKNGIRLSDSP